MADLPGAYDVLAPVAGTNGIKQYSPVRVASSKTETASDTDAATTRTHMLLGVCVEGHDGGDVAAGETPRVQRGPCTVKVSGTASIGDQAVALYSATAGETLVASVQGSSITLVDDDCVLGDFTTACGANGDYAIVDVNPRRVVVPA